MVLCPCVSANFGFLNSDGYQYGVLLGVGYYLLFGLVLSSLMIWRSRNWAIPVRVVSTSRSISCSAAIRSQMLPSPVDTPIPISPTPSVVPEDDESVSPVPASASAVVADPQKQRALRAWPRATPSRLRYLSPPPHLPLKASLTTLSTRRPRQQCAS